MILIGIGFQTPVLLKEPVLQEHLELNVKVKFPTIIVHGISPAQADILRPFIPALTFKEIFQCHEQRIIIQPPAVFRYEALIVRILADIAALIGHGQKDVAVLILVLIVNIIFIIPKVHAVAFFPCQHSLLDQFFQINKVGIARKGREGLVGRITIGGGMDRQDLPIGLACLLQPINKCIRFLGKTADAVFTRQAGDGH